VTPRSGRPASIGDDDPVTVRSYDPVTVRSCLDFAVFGLARPSAAGNGGSCPRSDPVTVRFYFLTPCRAGLDRRASGDGAFLCPGDGAFFVTRAVWRACRACPT